MKLSKISDLKPKLIQNIINIFASFVGSLLVFLLTEGDKIPSRIKALALLVILVPVAYILLMLIYNLGGRILQYFKKVQLLIVEEPEGDTVNILNSKLRDEKYINKIQTISRDKLADISDYNVVILNSINSDKSFEPNVERNLREFVEKGGGLIAIHDSIFPYRTIQAICNLVGVKQAYDGTIGQGVRLVAARTQEGKTSYFDLTVDVEDGKDSHPICYGIEKSFTIKDELFPINVVKQVESLFSVNITDDLPFPESDYFRKRPPIIVVGCQKVKKGRTCFCMLGHLAETYADPNFLTIIKNAVKWVAKKTS